MKKALKAGDRVQYKVGKGFGKGTIASIDAGGNLKIQTEAGSTISRTLRSVERITGGRMLNTAPKPAAATA